MNKTTVVVTALSGIALIIGAYALTRNGDAKACLGVYQKYFKDPKSAEILNVHRSERELEVDFTIANALGGRERHQVSCAVSDGKVNPELTKVRATLWNLERMAR